MNPIQRALAERVGRRIKTARKQAGLSHDKLAKRVGTSRQHLIKLEKGTHLPGPSMLTAIARETEKSESFFTPAGGDEDEDEADAVTDLVRALHRAAAEAVDEALAAREERLAGARA